MGWTVRGSNPDGGENFFTRPDQPCGPPSLLYNGYQVFPGGKAAEEWRGGQEIVGYTSTPLLGLRIFRSAFIFTSALVYIHDQEFQLSNTKNSYERYSFVLNLLSFLKVISQFIFVLLQICDAFSLKLAVNFYEPTFPS
jgi:hypothetical protein